MAAVLIADLVISGFGYISHNVSKKAIKLFYILLNNLITLFQVICFFASFLLSICLKFIH